MPFISVKGKLFHLAELIQDISKLKAVFALNYYDYPELLKTHDLWATLVCQSYWIQLKTYLTTEQWGLILTNSRNSSAFILP